MVRDNPVTIRWSYWWPPLMGKLTIVVGVVVKGGHVRQKLTKCAIDATSKAILLMTASQSQTVIFRIRNAIDAIRWGILLDTGQMEMGRMGDRLYWEVNPTHNQHS